MSEQRSFDSFEKILEEQRKKADITELQPVSVLETAEKKKEVQEVFMEFKGSGREYFKIWIVNTVLSIITLGIYTAWAKVRSKQYFYGNTYVDNVSFRYHGDPLRILKGRIIATFFFGSYMLTNYFYPLFSLAFIPLFLFAIPFFIIKSAQFNARYSSYRNIHFNFDGTYGSLLKIYISKALLTVVSLGLYAPVFLWYQKKYFIDHNKFGSARFNISGESTSFYGFAFVSGLIAMSAYFLIIFTAISKNMIIIIPMIAAVSAIFLFSIVYYQTNLFTTIINSTVLNKIVFSSSMTTSKAATIQIVNTIMLVLTLGLYYPWAKVNFMKYKIGSIKLLTAFIEIDEIGAVKKTEVNATGEEIGEVFDVDFGI